MEGFPGSGPQLGIAAWSLAFSPDGKTLAYSTSYANTVWLWDADPNSWVSHACQRVNRNLSQAEWDHYIGKNVPYHRTCPNLPPGEGVPAR
jgi:WD40 repeat protein